MTEQSNFPPNKTRWAVVYNDFQNIVQLHSTHRFRFFASMEARAMNKAAFNVGSPLKYYSTKSVI